jgi:Fe-Mn family superoxide dismutase
MSELKNRRQFLLQTGNASLGVWAAASAAPLVSACSVFSKASRGLSATGFKQDPLPYSYAALNDAIDATTMELHFTKHAAAYAANLQDAAKSEGVDTNKPLEEVLRNISKYSAKMRNNGGGHYNHELFWKLMAPNGGGNPQGKLATAIDSSFGSLDAFKTQFADAGKNRFGSGWAWLVLDGDKKLRIGSTPNQDNPLMNVAEFKGTPIMALDVWEHAYYLRYQNRRADYIANWWKVVNWDFVQKRYDAVL